MKIEKRDIPVIALCALGGFSADHDCIGKQSMATVLLDSCGWRPAEQWGCFGVHVPKNFGEK